MFGASYFGEASAWTDFFGVFLIRMLWKYKVNHKHRTRDRRRFQHTSQRQTMAQRIVCIQPLFVKLGLNSIMMLKINRLFTLHVFFVCYA